MNHIKTNRITELDIIKALGIICVVSGHSGAPYSKFIYQFHMAIFIICSGFFYKESASENLKSLSKAVFSKIKQLYFPFIAWNALFVVLHNLFIKLNIYTDNTDFLNYTTGMYDTVIGYYSAGDILRGIAAGFKFSTPEQLAGAFWFLKALFFISVSYLIIDYIAKKISKDNYLIIQFIVSVILLSFGYGCQIFGKWYFGFNIVSSTYFLYFLGHVISRHKEKLQSFNWIIYLTAFIITSFILWYMNRRDYIDLGNNIYNSPIILIIVSVSGWLFLYSISYFIKHIPAISDIMTAIGRSTLTIMVLHFLTMKITTLLAVKYYDYPAFCLASFPNLKGNISPWWILYIVSGVTIPTVLAIIYSHVKYKLTTCRKKRKTAF